MKKFYVVFLLMLSPYLFAQVGINTTTPHESSILDIWAPDKGLLIPRVALNSIYDITTIANPQESLLVYKTGPSFGMPIGFYYYNGSQWQPLAGSGGGGADAWKITGNNNINNSHFLGTTNYQSLMFRVNNTQVGRFHPLGGVALGYGAVANDNNGVAIGRDAKASRSNEASAIGYQADASGYRATALGHSAKAENNQSVAIGYQATSSGENGLAFGTGATTSALGSVSLGHSARATGEYATAIGYQSVVSAHNSVALGNIAQASGQFGMAIGNNTRAEGYESAAMGSGSRSTNQNSMAFGYRNTVTGYEGAAYGANNSVSGQNASAFGYQNSVSGYEALAVGMRSTATGQYAMAIGRKSTAPNASTIIIGNSLPLSDYEATHIGIGTNSPNSAARLDVDDPFKLGKEGSVHKSIISFMGQFTPESGTKIVEITIPSSNRPSSTRATVLATLANAAPDALSIIWVKMKDVNTLRVKYNYDLTIGGGTVNAYFSILEF